MRDVANPSLSADGPYLIAWHVVYRGYLLHPGRRGFRYIGLTKGRRQSDFARWDTRLYTPIYLVLAISHWTLYALA